MLHFRNYSIIVYVILFLSCITYSQETPMEWGVIPKSDLEMKSFPADTNASAVILCDYGQSYINDDLNLEFIKQERIKILNKKGFDWANFSIDINTKDDNENIDDIEGVTYNLDNNGNIVSTKLKDDDIFKDEVTENITRYRFTLPDLKPGCIIEVKYKIESKDLFYIKDWTFQESEPVLWSEYTITIPKNIAYLVVFQGYEQWYAHRFDYVQKYFHGDAASTLGHDMIDCVQYHFIVRDAPAIRDEPYITTVDNYVNKVFVQLEGYVFPGMVEKKEFMKDWASVVSELMDNDRFYDKIDVTGDIEDLADEITKGLTTDQEKLNAIYNWVTKSIVWTGQKRIVTDNDIDDVLEAKKGTSAEINFIFLSLLKRVGIKGYPVLLSTRDNGNIQKEYPIVSQFNYFLSEVVLGDKTYFIDPTDPLRPLNVLPKRVLNVTGLVIKEGPVQWVSITPSKNEVDQTLGIIKIENDGSIKGQIEERFGEYQSLSTRRKFDNAKDIEIAKDLLGTDPEGISIDSVSFTGKDSLEIPLQIKSWISSSMYAQKNGKLIYLNPFVVNRLKENPFKSKTRKFPVDFGYKRSSKLVLNITLPKDYEFKEPLQSKSFFVENDASYVRKVKTDKNQMQIICNIDINSSQISPDYYEKLRYFYSQIVSSESEQLVIGPIETPIKQIVGAKQDSTQNSAGKK